MTIARTKTIELEGVGQVTVRELTVAEIRAWLAGAREDDDGEVDMLGRALIRGMSFEDIARMSDLSVAKMEALPPSALEAVAEACREVNAHFFEMAGRLEALQSRLASGSSG